MRLCRYLVDDRPQVGFYAEDSIVSLTAAAADYHKATGRTIDLPAGSDLLAFLPPAGPGHVAARDLANWAAHHPEALGPRSTVRTDAARLLVPVPAPKKIFLLAGNYADHIREGGGIAAERAETFPYVFMKPATTTLTDPGRPIRLPAISPASIDWELELAVIIGARAKAISERDALAVVAGYTIVNDISNRKFRPNPNRKERPKDVFFDWLHGKWHDTFCPSGPCVVSADAVADPQALPMELRVNGEVRQHASTALQIFPVAAVIEFISNLTTLEPGDIISTGTPAGVGAAKGTFLKPGDVMHAHIGSIGTLVTPVEAENN